MTTPTQFGRYKVVRLLGSGGMADVFLADDNRLQRPVAIKALRLDRLNPELLARFDREAIAVAGLRHPAIVTVFDAQLEGDEPFLVMEFMSGGSLADRLDQGPYALEEALPIIERIAAALDYAHSQRLLHRDVKPGNILFNEHHEAYLSDFGIVRLLQDDNATQIHATREGVILGTVAYISPEQVRDHGEIGPASDIYSLGVVVFEMLAGRLPYSATSSVMLAAQHVINPIPSITDLRPQLPASIEPVIQRALAKSPHDRYPTCMALVDDLRRVASASEVVTPISAPQPVITAPVRVLSSPPSSRISTEVLSPVSFPGGVAPPVQSRREDVRAFVQRVRTDGVAHVLAWKCLLDQHLFGDDDENHSNRMYRGMNRQVKWGGLVWLILLVASLALWWSGRFHDVEPILLERPLLAVGRDGELSRIAARFLADWTAPIIVALLLLLMAVSRLLARVVRFTGDNRYLRSAADTETRLKDALKKPETDFYRVCQSVRVNKKDVAKQRKRLPPGAGGIMPTKEDALLAHCLEKGKLWALAVTLRCKSKEDDDPGKHATQLLWAIAALAFVSMGLMSLLAALALPYWQATPGAALAIVRLVILWLAGALLLWYLAAEWPCYEWDHGRPSAEELMADGA